MIDTLQADYSKAVADNLRLCKELQERLPPPPPEPPPFPTIEEAMLYHGYSEIAITVALKTAEEVMVHASGTTPSPSPARPRHFTPSRSPLRLESTADSIGTNESSLEEVKDEIKDLRDELTTLVYMADPLLAPIKLNCGLELKARIIKGSTTEGLADKYGLANEKHVKLYGGWAPNRFGIQIVGHFMSARRRAPASPPPPPPRRPRSRRVSRQSTRSTWRIAATSSSTPTRRAR